MNKKLVDTPTDDTFFNIFSENVYHSKYLIKYDSWITKSSYINQEKILNYYLHGNKIKYGFFSCFQSKMICIDIDAHNVKDDDIYKISFKKMNKLNYLLGVNPSAYELTDRGIHCFYFLTDYINSSNITEKLTELFKFNKLDIEVKGTCSIGMSIPKKENLVILDLTKIETSIFTSLFSYEKYVYLNKSISEIPLIVNGTSNDILCKIVPYLKYGCNYETSKIADILYSKLDKAYNGELLNRNRLLKRIEGFKKSTKIIFKRKIIEHKNVREVMNLINEKCDLSDKEKKSLHLIVNELLKNKDSFNELCSSKENLYYMNSKYAFSKFYYDRNATPVPSSFLKKINSHYNKYLKILLETGFMSFCNGRHYSVQGHSCIYYIIGFTKEVLESTQSFINSLIESINNLSITQNSNNVLNCLSESSNEKENLEKLIYNKEIVLT